MDNTPVQNQNNKDLLTLLAKQINEQQQSFALAQAKINKLVAEKMAAMDKHYNEREAAMDKKFDSYDKKMAKQQEQMNANFHKQMKTLNNYLPLAPGEEIDLQNKIHDKATAFTRKFISQFGTVSEDFFSAKWTHLSVGIINSLKRFLNSHGKLAQIRHTSFQKAMNYVSNLTLNDLPSGYLRLTKHQKDLLEGKD